VNRLKIYADLKKGPESVSQKVSQKEKGGVMRLKKGGGRGDNLLVNFRGRGRTLMVNRPFQSRKR